MAAASITPQAPLVLEETNDLARVDAHVPRSRRQATRNPYSPVMVAVSLMALIGILAYAWFLLNPANRGDLLPWLLVIFAEVTLIFHALMSMWTVLSGIRNPRTFAFHQAKSELYDADANAERGVSHDPTRWPMFLGSQEVAADLLITVYGEPVDVIRKTAEAALAVRGAHGTWILDDGRSDEVRDLAAELGCSYVRRLTSHGAKAGNVNNALTVAKAPFFVILDADFVPRPEFLEETLPFMVDNNVALVQTPQTYGNMHNIISRGAGYMQTMFYRFVQPGRNEFNAAFSVGTNVLYRRAAVLDIGGLYTDSKSEDVWTSLLLHERGWRSIYIPNTLAVGDAPETIEAYTKQQQRWATGGFEILLTHFPFSPRRRLTLDQRFMYFVTATHYLTGIAPGILLFVPALEIFFDLRPVNLTVGPFEWFLFYAGFYLLQILLAGLTLGTFRWEVLLLAQCSFPIYLRAFKNAFIGVDTKWSVTGATGGKVSPFNFIIPQVLVWVFLICATSVSVYRDMSLGHLNIATIWNGINLVALTAFMVVAYLEGRAAVGSARAAAATPLPDPVESSPEPLPSVVEVLDRSAIEGARRDVDSLLAGREPAMAVEPSTLLLAQRYTPGDSQLGVMPVPVRRGRGLDASVIPAPRRAAASLPATTEPTVPTTDTQEVFR
ncbi:glycosyltransferase family 2 protein [Propioniciclava soli]|uniref:Glycosyltransferase family 2 protein n=1 Tax=Propioniciclava soli TaxID=2775081 RepID=A0ABZ3CCW5_9ACTN|nr:cellulose synthase catalytic subunit [Propioniciclava soli]